MILFKDTHLFSIYLENLSDFIADLKSGQEFFLKNKSLYKRLVRVLRLTPNEYFILFDKSINVEFCLLEKSFEKENSISAKILSINKNKPFRTQIIFCPSLLKKSSFEEIVYIASAMGANQIVPLITEKVKRKWGGKTEQERLLKIIISSCEQSKNFVLPQLHDLRKLEEVLKTSTKDTIKKVFFDMNGEPLFDLLKDLNEKKIKKIILLFGPEGGFSDQEIKLLKDYSFECYKLTPTILRSVEAVAVGLGSVRSVGS